MVWGEERKAYLVSLDPDDFVDACVAPHAKTLSTDFHRTARYPEEEETLVLKHGKAWLPADKLGRQVRLPPAVCTIELANTSAR